LVALFGTHGIECECLLFPTDVELYNASCNINHGFGGIQDGCMSSDTAHSWEAILEYHEVHRPERIPDSQWDIIRGSHWKLDQLICQMQMQGSRDQGIMI
jgi:hypothetical protein